MRWVNALYRQETHRRNEVIVKKFVVSNQFDQTKAQCVELKLRWQFCVHTRLSSRTVPSGEGPGAGRDRTGPRDRGLVVPGLKKFKSPGTSQPLFGTY